MVSPLPIADKLLPRRIRRAWGGTLTTPDMAEA